MLHMVFRKIQGYLEPRFIWLHYVSRIFRHIQKVAHNRAYFFTLGLRPGQSNIKHYPLFKSGSSFKSLFRSIWNIFFCFCKSQQFRFSSSGQYCSKDNNNNNIMQPMLGIHPPHQYYTRQQATHATHASALHTQARNLSNSCQHATHTSTSPMQLIQDQHPCHTPSRATHGSTSPTPPTRT